MGGPFKVREYEPALWVSTNVTDSYDLNNATGIGFRRLFNYISGSNVGKQKVNMTSPVTVDIYPGQGPECYNFVISFYIPFKYQVPSNPPPKPTEKDVYINPVARRQITYVDYGGFSDENKVLEEAEALYAKLEKAGDQLFDKTVYSQVGYDSPYR